ncbi:MAG: cob(I)yrinic acid a,c-diamide adenosyltransferase [Planctomycetaceae bacterium]|jgi:cob(I)alamin adenosyltransferase|nr:cob(I)yrinic acid a,c-diamide adenosyltransferase [Planctomycetaceae bacterium]
MTVSTKKGDLGMTNLACGKRVSKSSLSLEVCGTLDELCSFLGLLRAEKLSQADDLFLDEIQKNLLTIAGEISMAANTSRIVGAPLSQLEQEMIQLEKKVPPLTSFLLPSGTRTAALFHVVRTVCRRLERHMVALQESESAVLPLAYINRLSDFFFIMARMENQRKNVREENL